MEYLIHITILIAIYAILGLSLNLVIGYTGLLSITHAAFYGIGAYAAAILTVSFGMNFFLAAAIGMVLAALAAFLISLVMSRFRDDYYALVSFGFCIIVWSIFLNWQDVTRGPLGIPGIGRPVLFGFAFSENIAFLVLAAIFVAATYAISSFITKSSFGRVLKAIREDEPAVQSLGYNTSRFKLAIFTIAAAMAGLAGALFASYLSYIDPSSFSINESIFILAIVILGGLASLRGSILGAAFLILLPEILRFVGFPSDIAAQMRQFVYGALLILLMLYRPQGLIGEYEL